MSAVLPLRQWHSPWPVLRNCVPTWICVAVLIGSGLLFAVAGLVVVGNQPALAILPCVLAVALAWMLWFSNLLNLHLEARQSRMPVLARMVGVALICAWLVTALLPAMVLVWAGWAFITTLSILTCVAACSLLVFQLPRALLVACCCMPMMFNLLNHVAVLPSLPQWSWQMTYWPWLAVGMVLLVAWCWRFNLRWAERASGVSWWQPLGLARLQMAKTAHGRVMGYQEPWRAWAWLQEGRVQAGPDNPPRAMRSLIGGAYAPMNWRRLLVEMLGLMLAVAFFAQLDNHVLRAGMLAALAIMGGFAPMAYGQRLEMLYSQQARELDELALLPGWGEAAQARASLLRAIAWSPLCLLLQVFVLTPVMLVALHVAVTPVDVAALVLMAVLCALLSALVCLCPVAGVSLTGWKGGLSVSPGLILIVLGASRIAFEYAGHAALLLGALLLACIGYGLAVHAAWRRFQARPHPFLRN
ncbi:MAG: hypothetical protein QM612_07890 [Thermomonas sp.]|uniref:hypothetical protein n=1 Tax=Thermomonas sp. TaxID=1971895 RepID=UPI0039E7131E